MLSTASVIDGFNTEVASTYLIMGSHNALTVAVLGRCPGKEIDFWPLSSPPADEF